MKAKTLILMFLLTAGVFSVYAQDAEDEVPPAPAPAEHAKPKTAMDPEKLAVGISFELSGFLISGPMLRVEFTKGNLLSQVHFGFPSLGAAYSEYHDITDGITVGVSFNHFDHKRTGGFYSGGMAEYSFVQRRQWPEPEWDEENEIFYTPDSSIRNDFAVGLAASVGYKFVLKSGLNFIAGGYLGMRYQSWRDNLGVGGLGLLFKPNLSVGYHF